MGYLIDFTLRRRGQIRAYFPDLLLVVPAGVTCGDVGVGGPKSDGFDRRFRAVHRDRELFEAGLL